MTNSDFQAGLRKAALFQEFSDEEFEASVELLDTVQFQAGQCIVRQDDPGDAMYLLVEGTARVIHHHGGREVELAVLKGGDFFGELALVDHGPRSADVEALQDCSLLRVSQAEISALAGVYPMAAFKFLVAIGRLMVARLRKSNQRYIDSMLFPMDGKD